jgi:imidazoleglycerol phosphate synthase glutamine amidotransferase subunit HisH
MVFVFYYQAMKKDFKLLKKHYGSHVAVAKELGVSATHYRRLRNQNIGSQMLRKFITMKANEIRQIKLMGAA